jgi:hypothetical protein
MKYDIKSIFSSTCWLFAWDVGVRVNKW